ncbi:hypothetical protein GPLA_1818 [Paraglaciecola polaris LMG 21857]|uniref:Uncharacterized protein n=1 Tax=Paraglaciecola polaris LMG 21857 TaxID=1129793 RepID=K7ABH4_9ALTE|nr:hypothetical protein GPLA_1818 [Paraglaciecola polaris LMG 21857]
MRVRISAQILTASIGSDHKTSIMLTMTHLNEDGIVIFKVNFFAVV